MGYSNLHYLKNKDRYIQNNLIWRKKNPEKISAYKIKWRLANPEKCLWMSAKGSAKKRGIEFNISFEDIEIPAICPILKIPIKINTGKGTGFQNDSASIDRIDNTKGYVKGNIRVISNRANSLKKDATLEELELIFRDAYCIRHRN